jgi:hypothetical protein
MQNIIQQIGFIGLTALIICFILYIVVKIITIIVTKNTKSKLKHRQSVIHNIEQIDRGYQDIERRLNNIGADIRRIG